MEAEKNFIDQFQSWACTQPDIRGAFIIGSYGRKNAAPWSDIDLAFITRKPERYQQPRQWLNALGEVWSAIYDPDDSVGGLPTSASLFCAFSGGVSVDFSILPYGKTALWLRLMRTPFLRERLFAREAGQAAYMFQQGVEVLFDHDGLIRTLEATVKPLPAWSEPPPSRQQFDALQDDFYLGVVKMVRLLMNHQLYGAYNMRDRWLRRCLLRLLQWEAQARQREWNNPLSYRDKAIEKWADREVAEALPVIFGGYSDEALWEALIASIQCFNAQSQKLASLLDYSLDHRTAEIEAWVNQLWQQR